MFVWEILKYLDFVVIIASWGLIFLPWFKLKKHPQSLSQAVLFTKNRWTNLGLVISGVAQIGFYFYLKNKFDLNYFPAGLMFNLGSIFLILTGFISVKCYSRLHWILAFAYLILIGSGGFFISFSLRNFDYIFSLLAICSIIFLYISMFYWKMVKKDMIKAQISCLFFSSMWALFIYKIVFFN